MVCKRDEHGGSRCACRFALKHLLFARARKFSAEAGRHVVRHAGTVEKIDADQNIKEQGQRR